MKRENNSLIDVTVPRTGEVKLDCYRPEYLEGLLAFELTQEHLQFTSLPKDALEPCKEDAGRHPVVILWDGVTAGFFVLYQGEELSNYTDNPNAILLRAYSISHQFQGRGIAGKSLALLSHYVEKEFAQVDEVVLAVNRENEAAQRVYLRVGFEDSGKRIMGRMGEQFVYGLKVKGGATR